MAFSCNTDSYKYMYLYHKGKDQCTEGWECNLGSRELEIFFANNGLGGFLGPNWKGESVRSSTPESEIISTPESGLS